MLEYLKSIIHTLTAPGKSEGGGEQSFTRLYGGVKSRVRELRLSETNNKIQETPAIAMVYAHWCPHCTELPPIYERLAEAMEDYLEVVAINFNDPANKEFISNHKINKVPTIIYCDNDGIKEVQMQSKDLRGFVDSICYMSGSGNNCCGDINKPGKLKCNIAKN